MKKALLIALTALTLQAFADSDGVNEMAPSIWSRPENQDLGGSAVTLMPFLGVADMNVKGSGTSGNWSSDIGLSAGALAELGHGFVTFQTGILYDQFGAKSSGAAPDGSQRDVTLNLSYLNVPGVAKFNFMGDAVQTVYGKAGIMPGVLVTNNITSSAGGDSRSMSADHVSSFDIPAVIGLGGAMQVTSRGSLIVEANYVRGLTNISTDSGGEIHNEGFIFGAGFSIPL